MTNNGGYVLDVEFGDEEGVSDARLGEYRVYLKSGERRQDILMVRDFSTDYSPIHFEITEAMKEAGLSSACRADRL